MKTKDWIVPIEAGYSLEGDDESWLKNVLDQTAPLFDRGYWLSIYTYHFTPTTAEVQLLLRTSLFSD